MAVMERDRTEERIDRLEGEIREFRAETNARFDKVNEEFVAVRKEMKDGFDKLNRTMVWFCGILLASFFAQAFAG
jgi:hypothetical protein